MTYLIVEKQTGLELGNTDNISKQGHRLQQESKNQIVETLTNNKLDYHIIKDFQLQNYNTNNFEKFISLGGDGTALHLASKLNSNQILIPLNSQKQLSRGALTVGYASDLEQIISENKIQIWDRLGAKINSKQIKQYALNEILISNNLLSDTSHILLNNKKLLGNGLICSTFKGQTGFYSSANGKPFLENEYGIVPLFPIGDSISQTYNSNKTFGKLIPKRDGIKLIFDSKKEKEHLLKVGDEVEIFISNNHLKVLTK